MDIRVTPVRELNREICEAWRKNGQLDDLFAQFVVETGSRAAGCWKLEDRELVLLGFGSADDMSVQVSAGFRSATLRVHLDQTRFGIVRAVVTDRSTIAHRDPLDTGLDASATWIAKFRADTSLAVPIHQANSKRIVGVIAVSTANTIEVGDSLWERMAELANELGAAH